jgi:hypothetical protein
MFLISSSMKGPVLVAGGSTQWDDALRIGAALDARARVLHLGNLEVLRPPPPGTPYEGGHWPQQGLRDIAAFRRLLRRILPVASTLVLGQDAARLPRVAARAARRAGVPIAVVPDGALFRCAPYLGTRERVQELALRAAGWTAGSPNQFGSTRPDLWCAWGEGWVRMLQDCSPRGRVVVTGSPRAGDLRGIDPPASANRRLLICSQPTWVPPFPPSTTAGPEWYRWLERIASSAPVGRLAVRLHPRERDLFDQLDLGPATRAALSDRGPLAADIAASDAVIAPFSTVLIEAAAAARPVISVVPETACRAVRAGSPAMRDPRLQVHVTHDLADFGALDDAVDRADVDGWGQDFCLVAVDSAQRCAAAITDLAR